jgi:IgGFc binding protein
VLALLACTAFAVLPVAAQATSSGLSNAGTEFWLGFPTNYGGGTQLTLYITGSTATTGTVTVPGEAFSEAFSVTPGSVTAVKLPSGAQSMTSDGIEEKAIHVTAGEPVVVYGLNDYPFTTDAYTALPTEVVGTSYTVLAFGSGLGGNSEFSVVATQNDTEVTITPSVNGGESDTRPAGVPYTITLNQGQEYQLRATTNPEDLTGTKITSTAPVSVFGGEQCANVPDEGYYACDYIVEQNIPDSAWGTSFLTEPLKTRKGGDDFEMVADQDGTEVSLNGTVIATLNAGEHYSQEVEGASEWTSNKPIELAQYSNSSSFDGTTGDPFMIIIPPYQQFETGYTITTPVNSETVFGNYVNLVVPKSAVGLVAVDGTPVPAAEYNPIGSSEFEGVQVDLEPGSHVITGNGEPFGAFSYGFSEYNGYGYYGGMSLAPVAEVTNVTLEPATETALVNTEKCVTATVTDQNGKALPSVRVDFLVSGANSAEGPVFAGSEGKATFCYTGANLGSDSITGSVGAIKGSAAKTWVTELPKTPEKTTTTTTTTPAPTPKGEVASFGVAHLASSAPACVASNGYVASVRGSLIASVTFTLGGHKVATVTKPNSHGVYATRIKLPIGSKKKLAIKVTFTSASKVHETTIQKTLARCAVVHHISTPRFTG